MTVDAAGDGDALKQEHQAVCAAAKCSGVMPSSSFAHSLIMISDSEVGAVWPAKINTGLTDG